MLSDKFFSFLNEEGKALGSLIFDSIFKTGERLLELVISQNLKKKRIV